MLLLVIISCVASLIAAASAAHKITNNPMFAIIAGIVGALVGIIPIGGIFVVVVSIVLVLVIKKD